jgi:hypothetical protein
MMPVLSTDGKGLQVRLYPLHACTPSFLITRLLGETFKVGRQKQLLARSEGINVTQAKERM